VDAGRSFRGGETSRVGVSQDGIAFLSTRIAPQFCLWSPHKPEDAVTTVAPLSGLPALWRARAELMRRHGALEAAATCDACAQELEAAAQRDGGEVLTLGQAAAESGKSAGHLARLVRSGSIPNAGRKHAPRILRRHLAGLRKGGVVRDRPQPYDPLADARSLASRLQPNGGEHGGQ
jgi:hypothetical protein